MTLPAILRVKSHCRRQAVKNFPEIVPISGGRVSDPPLRWRMEFDGEVCPVRADNGILVGVGEKWV